MNRLGFGGTEGGMRMVGYAAMLSAAVATTSAHADTPDASALARSALDIMRGDAAHVRSLLAEARGSHAPAPRLACIDGALTRADVAVRVARDLYAELRAALVAADGTRAATMLRAVLVQREAARHAIQDADACVSPVARAADGTTTVRMTVDRSLPPD